MRLGMARVTPNKCAMIIACTLWAHLHQVQPRQPKAPRAIKSEIKWTHLQ